MHYADLVLSIVGPV